MAVDEIFGGPANDDYKIQPARHAQEFEKKAPQLAAILRRSDIATIAAEFEKCDAEANRNQAIFKKVARKANWAVLLTACFSTLLLIVGSVRQVLGLSQDTERILLVVLGVFGVLAGAAGVTWVTQARSGKLLENWMNSRASAENLRREYFEAIANLDLPGAVPLQLGYFLRFQFNVQLAFYERRSGDHRRDADRFLHIGSISVGAAAAAAGLAAVLSTLNPAWASIAALGGIATAIAAFAATQETTQQSRRNAELYRKTLDALNRLRRKLDEVRAAADAGRPEAVRQFVAAAHEQYAAEHRQWLDAEKSIEPAIEKLDETLQKLQPKGQSAAGGDQ
jgi:SMODS and SLOG-associating 2TM effector domain 1